VAAVATLELNTPGYWHDLHSSVHIMIQGNPMLTQDELGLLSKFGLKYTTTPTSVREHLDDQTTIITYKDLDKAWNRSPRSRRAMPNLPQVRRQSARMLPMFISGLYSPPIPLGALSACSTRARKGRELLDAMQRSALDIANGLFENEKIKIHLVKLITENIQMPDELGTGLGMYLMPGIHPHLRRLAARWRQRKLTESLVRCIEH